MVIRRCGEHTDLNEAKEPGLGDSVLNVVRQDLSAHIRRVVVHLKDNNMVLFLIHRAFFIIQFNSAYRSPVYPPACFREELF
jgi:hypothetical protein